ncbi:MAG: phosphoribosylglycinamide formyltransferase [Planctomycetota bacterium]|nr:phosphoribosylglycinamide formyltransferase [Planctomycetota bacterium]
MTLRLAVLASGGGRTLQNFIDLANAGKLDVEVIVVGVSKSKCGAAERASKAGIPCFARRKKKSESVDDFSTAIFDQIRPQNVDLVCLAGYLSLIRIPDDFENRVLNIHPSLIPAFCGRGFYGEKVHKAAWEAGVKVTGCTVHFCDNIYDNGPILLQETVSVSSEDSPECIAKKVFEAECLAYPKALSLVNEGRVSIQNGRCQISNS